MGNADGARRHHYEGTGLESSCLSRMPNANLWATQFLQVFKALPRNWSFNTSSPGAVQQGPIRPLWAASSPCLGLVPWSTVSLIDAASSPCIGLVSLSTVV